MAKCPECATEFEAGQLFCPKCGCDVSRYEEPGDDAIPDAGAPPPAAGEPEADAAAPDEPFAAGVQPGPPAAAPPPGEADAAVSDFVPDEMPPAPAPPEQPEPVAPPPPAEPVEGQEEAAAPTAGPEGPEAGAAPVEPPAPPPEPAVPPAPPVPAPEPTPTGKCERCGVDSATPVCPVCAKSPEPHIILNVDGFEPVRYRGRKVHRVPITLDEVLVGRRDAAKNIYPEIDLSDFHSQGFISRSHAKVLFERDKHFLTDVAGRETTAIVKKGETEPRTVAVEEKVELEDGDRFIIGDAVSFTVILPGG